ncbi:GxxExxY protein, partial [Candidatus Falkowbacteria bacterium]|nr:GxxExxY protein [Candidatus Falkowbacteria bacterium]
MAELIYKEDSYIVQGAFYAIYKTFRNSQKEKVYHNSLIIELNKRKVKAEKNKRLEIFYEGSNVGIYVPDIIVNNKIIIEIKCKPFLHKDDISQFWNYLK